MGDHDNPARLARSLIRRAPTAALATALPERDGPGGPPWPFASLVLSAADHDGTPLLFLSSLAEHSRNISVDDRISLLFDGTGGLEDPLTGARLTLLGQARISEEIRHRKRFLARHPSAEAYAEFTDFSVYSIEPTRAHLVAGFGRIDWIAASDVLLDAETVCALADAEADIVTHMNEDHADAIALYATALLGRAGGAWRMTGIDADGCDLWRDGELTRLDFPAPISTRKEARETLVRLAEEARGRSL